MPRRADFAHRLIPGLGLAGFVALAIITFAHPASTRMHAWPWSIAYALALLAPAVILLLRVYDRARPLVLPSRPWFYLGLAAGLVIIASGMASPYRGPSLLWSTPLLAGLAVFFVLFDWLQAAPGQSPARRDLLLKVAGIFFALVAIVSLALWALPLGHVPSSEVFEGRNPYPLGHSNYTAGIALLMLPCFVSLAARASGLRRIAWVAAGVLALGLLFTSGSRGGFVGLAALLFAGSITSRLGWRKTLLLALAAAAGALLLALANPRTRAMFTRADPAAAPNVSNVQRTAMMDAALHMGRERPVLGWGPGATPLAFPRFRAKLHGGVEDALQLHSLPFQLLAEFGFAGLAVFILFLGLVIRAAARERLAAVTLLAYAVFALTDYQLDLPVFAFAIALFAALLASPIRATDKAPYPRVMDIFLRIVLVCLAGFARPDPTPAMNLRALTLGRDAVQSDEAIELLKTSLALNPDQEIAHFNLGWLLVVAQPAEAEAHFRAAAHLVPDKGGVYFGLGLARLNRSRKDDAARAMAQECVDDPVFLISPWWKDPVVGTLRPAVFAETLRLLEKLRAQPLPAHTAAEAAYLAALVPWLDGTAPASGELAARANTPERAAYFSLRPAPPPFAHAVVRYYRRERSGYPVLMRNLDLPVPLDLFEVQENLLATGDLRFLFPAKGWLGIPPE